MLTTIALGTIAGAAFFGGIAVLYAGWKLGKKEAYDMLIYVIDTIGVIGIIWALLAIIF